MNQIYNKIYKEFLMGASIQVELFIGSNTRVLERAFSLPSPKARRRLTALHRRPVGVGLARWVEGAPAPFFCNQL